MTIKAVVLASSVFVLAGCGSAIKYEDNPLKAHVEASNVRLVVTNNDGSPWADVTIAVNDKFKTKAQTFGTGAPGAEYALTEFAADDGERFNPLTMKVRRVRIDATVNGRRASYGGDWK